MFHQTCRAVSNGFAWLSRNGTRKQLLGLNDHTLADFGFSREALLRGNGAFPWRVETDSRSASRQLPSTGRATVTELPPHAIASANVLALTLSTAVLASGQPLRKAA